ncbi:hypothetical protein I302_100111 [Kwoniella bestiolae CBS 10118]|uniref:F-box domain-containing protein n=1 Tax=Kwoniella bestiolae CBS 10118 TaxID=1296100 RepID=A0A1B9G455_9TREE|nr:hypothetical protein I302_03487 [Kwoniella bestiolae CBS 10118]OCF25814.1 hypothetical protein I302_03487 [Kwoniella bestiolae CBS 10118]
MDSSIPHLPNRSSDPPNLQLSAQASSPFDLSRLPAEVSSLLLEWLSRTCDPCTLLSLMCLSRDFYEFFGPALYRNITLTPKLSTSLFRGLDFDLQRKTYKDAWDRRQRRLVMIREEEERSRSLFGRMFRKKIVPLDDVDEDKRDPLVDLTMVDALSVHRRKVHLMSGMEWMTIQSFEGIYFFSQVVKTAHQTVLHPPPTTLQDQNDEAGKIDKRLFDNLHGICFKASITSPQLYRSMFQSPEYITPLSNHLRPHHLCLYISEEKDLEPGSLGVTLEDLCKGWYLHTMVYHIHLPNLSRNARDMGNINYTANKLIKKLLRYPVAKKIIFDFGNSCTHDPRSLNISPKTTAELNEDGHVSWELVDLNCWNTIGAVVAKVGYSDWIRKSSRSTAIPSDEGGASVSQHSYDEGYARTGEKAENVETASEMVRPTIEIHGLPCIQHITVESIKLAANQLAQVDGDGTHVPPAWKKERDEWLEAGGLRVFGCNETAHCECPASMGEHEVFERTFNRS